MTFLRASSGFRPAIFLLLTILLVSVELAVTRTSAFNLYPAALSMAILFDLVFATTGLFYWLVARPRQLANSRLILVALLVLRLGFSILPQTTFLSAPFATVLLVIAEGSVLAIAILRIQTILKTYRQFRLAMNGETALRGAIASVFGDQAAGFIIGEGLTFYYILLGWRLRTDVPTGAQILTTHRQSGQVALTIGLLVVGLIEAIVTHLLLDRWYPVMAGWLTALSIYSLLFFVADLIATLKRPSYLTHNQLNLRLGICWRAQIDRSLITTSLLIHEKPPKQSDLLNTSFLTAPNVHLFFREPVTVTGPFGITKIVQQITFFVDDRAALVQAIHGQPLP